MEKLEKTLEEWRAMLDPEQYNVCRLKGTERPFSGKYNDSKVDGVYHCICCTAPLFDSKTKFDSGCGWPSFYAPIGDSAMVEIRDVSHGMIRTEVVCAKCDAHLGHVFRTVRRPLACVIASTRCAWTSFPAGSPLLRRSCRRLLLPRWGRFRYRSIY